MDPLLHLWVHFGKCFVDLWKGRNPGVLEPLLCTRHCAESLPSFVSEGSTPPMVPTVRIEPRKMHLCLGHTADKCVASSGIDVLE